MHYGDLGKRFAAWLIDSLVLFLIGAILGYVLTIMFMGWLALIIAPFISIIYYTVMEGGEWHATLGKRAMGLYVADSCGNGISYSTSILRSLGKILSGMVLGIGYIMSFFNDEKQCLHDMLAKTYVLSGQAKSFGGGAGSGRPELICVNGPLAGMIYDIPREGLLIGRDSMSCQVIMPSSQSNVSRVHCLVTYNPMSGMFVLSDRNSSLGTFLNNGIRVSYSKPTAIRSGSRFYLASPDNMFEVR